MEERTVVIYGFETSNNLKVRFALAYKGIAHEFRAIDPADRSEVLRISGQFLTPVLVHGETVLFDSAAILRYLDANFPETPKLYGASLGEQWEIEEWERFGRGPLAASMMLLVHARREGREIGPEERSRAVTAFEEALARIESRLAGRRFLVGDGITAADLTCGAVIHRVRSSGVLPWPAAAPRCLDLGERMLALLG